MVLCLFIMLIFFPRRNYYNYWREELEHQTSQYEEEIDDLKDIMRRMQQNHDKLWEDHRAIEKRMQSNYEEGLRKASEQAVAAFCFAGTAVAMFCFSGV